MNFKPETIKELVDILKKVSDPFVTFDGTQSFTDGWKLSIQGKTVEDGVEILSRLMPVLNTFGIYHKIGTQRLIDHNSEQSTKMLTVYLPNNVDPISFATLISPLLDGYTGADNVEPKVGYTKFSQSIYYRNDRNENGEYLYPDGRVAAKT